MGRWARGNEISCGGTTGGCRILAEWLIRSDLYPGLNWPVCWLHRDSHKRLMIERRRALNPEVVPFQDPSEKPRTKRKQNRRS